MRRLLATLFCAAMLFGATSAQAASPADAYPSGPISLVVCYTPGGATAFPPLWPKIRNTSASPSSSSTSPARAA